MVPSMKDNMQTGRKRERDIFHGWMALLMKVTSKTITFMATVSISGLMTVNLRATG